MRLGSPVTPGEIRDSGHNLVFCASESAECIRLIGGSHTKVDPGPPSSAKRQVVCRLKHICLNIYDRWFIKVLLQKPPGLVV